MNDNLSLHELIHRVNLWSRQNDVEPMSGQASATLTERTIRYYRAKGLLDAPAGSGRYSEKHYYQLLAVRLLQAQGLSLERIQFLIYGRTLEELKEIEKRGLDEQSARPHRAGLNLSPIESWTTAGLEHGFMLVNRQGKVIPTHLINQFNALLNAEFSINKRKQKELYEAKPAVIGKRK